MNKILILSAERSGNHLITRSLSKSLKIPYGIFINESQAIKVLEEYNNYIAAIHIKKSEINLLNLKENIVCSIYRNPLDHALSLLRFERKKIDPNSKDFINWIKGDYFQKQRKIILENSENFVFNYDKLLNKEDCEKHIEEINNYFKINNFEIESINETKQKISPRNVAIGMSGRWRDIITLSTWSILIDIIDEPLNKYWDNPNISLTENDGFINYIKDFKIG